MTRNGPHGGEDGLILNAGSAQALEHPAAQALACETRIL